MVLSVYIDGALRVRRSVRSVWANPNGPHDVPDEIPLHLSSGSHTVRVGAEGTTASAEMQIVVGDAPVHASAAFGVGSCGHERPSSEATVEIHVLPKRPGWCQRELWPAQGIWSSRSKAREADLGPLLARITRGAHVALAERGRRIGTCVDRQIACLDHEVVWALLGPKIKARRGVDAAVHR